MAPLLSHSADNVASAVRADTRNEAGSQKFVLWAGALLERREEFEAILPQGGGRFSFSILVHCDNSGPMVEFLTASCVLQVLQGRLFASVR